MVDLQLIGVLVTAASATIAMVFYILNLRETARNRRVTLTTTLMQRFMTIEGMKHFYELYSMEWSSLDDYRSKYDSRVNPDNFAKRMSMWNLCDSLGQLYREDMIDLKTLRGGAGNVIQYMWIKFKPVIEMYRGTDFSPVVYQNFEYVAEKLIELERQMGDSEAGKRPERVIQEHFNLQ